MSSAIPPELQRAPQVYNVEARSNPNLAFFSISKLTPMESKMKQQMKILIIEPKKPKRLSKVSKLFIRKRGAVNLSQSVNEF